MIHGPLKAAFRRVLSDYGLYLIYRATDRAPGPKVLAGTSFGPVNSREIVLSAPSETIRNLADYIGEDAAGFGAWVDGKLVSLCWFWWGQRYRSSRTVWPLSDGEAKLVQISTDESFRCRQIATNLIRYGACEMRQQGAGQLYARIWHSHTASIKAFENAGWQKIAYVGRVAFRRGQYYRLILQQEPTLRVSLSRQNKG
jgi:hypothetical protein